MIWNRVRQAARTVSPHPGRETHSLPSRAEVRDLIQHIKVHILEALPAEVVIETSVPVRNQRSEEIAPNSFMNNEIHRPFGRLRVFWPGCGLRVRAPLHKQLKTVALLLALAHTTAAHADTRFATRVVSFSGLGASPYNDPNAALGKPTLWVKDTVNGGPQQRVAASVAYGAWGVDPQGQKLVTTIQNGGHLTVEFDPPITDHSKHWWGYDFIVFGNSFFNHASTVRWDTDLGDVFLGASGDWMEPSPVSVSPDGVQWYTYPLSSRSAADALWPTSGIDWDESHGVWGDEQDWTKPVPPWLTRSQLMGKSAAQVIQAYQGSAGGCAFDLAPSGFSSIRYIRVDGRGGEVDGFSRVSMLQPTGILKTLFTTKETQK